MRRTRREEVAMNMDADLYKLRPDNVEKVIDFFSEHDNGTAAEIGVSGSFMSSLCNRGVAKVAGKKEYVYHTVDLIPKVRKTTCYKLTMEVEDFIEIYNVSCIDYLQGKIDTKTALLEDLEDDIELLRNALKQYLD